MAVTSIWDVKGSVATITKYVANPNKQYMLKCSMIRLNLKALLSM